MGIQARVKMVVIQMAVKHTKKLFIKALNKKFETEERRYSRITGST